MNGFLHNPVFAGFVIALLFSLFALAEHRSAMWALIVAVAFLAWLEITHHGNTLNGLALLIADQVRELISRP